MKKKRTTNTWIKGAGILVAAVMLLWTIPQTAMAAGTASGTGIDNRASVDYQVGGVDQTPIESAPAGNSTPGTGNGADTSFVVDTSLDMSVVWQDATVNVVPGAQDQVLRFEVTNDGNATQDFSLSAVASSLADDFDADNVNVYVESGATAGYQAAEDTVQYIDDLAADGTQTVYIVADIPLTPVNGDTAIYDLVAQVALASGSPGTDITTDDSGDADDPTTVQTVFVDAAGTAAGDAAEDGTHSDDGTYTVATAALEVTKTSSVVSDPINGTTNPKAIPGAIIEYEITVENTGTSSATSVTVTDSVPANTVFVVGSVAGDGDSDDYSNDNGTTWGYSPAGTTDANVTDIQIVFNSIAAGNAPSATFQVEVE